jgi:histidyl-tRNA synthetase
MGFGSGIERIILEMQRSGVVFESEAAADVYIVHKAEGAESAVFGLASRLRSAGVAAVLGETSRSFKAQMRAANSSGARFAVIIGEDEFKRGAGTIKDLAGEGEQEVVELGRVPTLLSARLKAKP